MIYVNRSTQICHGRHVIKRCRVGDGWNMPKTNSIATTAVDWNVGVAGIEDKNENQCKQEVIVLQPSPCLTEEPVPELHDRTSLHLKGFNILPVIINNMKCTMYVDSGTTKCFVQYGAAVELGLISKVNVKQVMRLYLWNSEDIALVVGVIEKVKVQFAKDFKVQCQMFVFPPRPGEEISHLPPILLDNSTLRRMRAIQTFKTECSSIHLKQNGLNRENSLGDVQYIMLVEKKMGPLQQKFIFKVHIDTGATNFYISRRCINLLNLSAIPKSVSFVCRGSRQLDSGPVHLTANDTFDIVMGKMMMARYRCAFDYERLNIFFHVGHRVIKAKLFTQTL